MRTVWALSPPAAENQRRGGVTPGRRGRGEVCLPLEDAVMRRWKSPNRLLGLMMLLLTSIAGCAVTVQPWSKPGPTGAPPADAAAANTHAATAFKAPPPTPVPPNPYPLPN